MGSIKAWKKRQLHLVIGFLLVALFSLSAGSAYAGTVITKCNDCHGMPPKDAARKGNPTFQADVSATVGSHQKHLGATPVANDCVVCHGGTAITATDHQNGVINMASPISGGTYGKGVFFNQTSIPLLNATARCSNVTCHADPYSAGTVTTPIWGSAAANCSACHTTPIGATGPATGGHAAHSFVCTSCHTSGTTATSMPSSGHIDTNITVVNVGYPATVAKHAAGSGYSTCSTAACHINVYGSGTVTTPVWGASAGCSACHAVAIDATGPATGSHVAHNNPTCTDCHNAGTTSTTKPNSGHLDGTITVTNGYPVTAKHAVGSYTGTCNTAVCHADVYGAGTMTTPVWGTSAGCSACHTTPIAATGPATGSHVAHNNPTCTDCHNAGTTATTVPSTGHADGNIDVTNGYPANVPKHAAGTYTGTCSTASCHADVYSAGSMTTPVWGTTAGCSACHTIPIAATGPATGSHVKHNNPTCTVCHNAGTTATTVPNTGHADGNIDVTNGYPANVTKHAAGTYTGTCSTASCHANVYGSGTVATPVWGATAANCTACHTTPIASTGPATGSHAKHNVTDCSLCHTGATTSAAMPTANHANGNIDVADGYPSTVAKHAAGSYTGTCSTASCHANVYGTGTVTTPVWGTASGCTACHTTPIASTGPATGSHAKHNVTDCSLCHTGATTNAATPTANHIDGNIDVTNGYPANVAKHAAGSYTGTCSTASCHANVYGSGTVTTPVWGTASGCTACHTTPIASTGPATGSHAKHSVTDCSLCHAGATTSTALPTANHIDGNIDVTNGYPANVAKHAIGTYTGTCSTASCHANVYGTGTMTTPAWGTTAGCSACHTTPIGATGPATGSHVVHNISTCTACHNAGTTATTVPGTGHANGFIDVTNGYPANVTKHAAGTYTGTCSTAICHGQGAPTWGATSAAPVNGFPYSSAQCGKCHAQQGSVTAGTPFYSTAIPKVTSNLDAKVGAHTAHISASESLHPGLGCIDCHGTVALNDPTHMKGSTTFNWSALAKTGNLSPSYDPTTGKCSNVYCHGGAMPGGDTSGSNRTPTWNNPNYLPATLTVAGCSTCHGFPPSASVGHPAVTIPAGFPTTAAIGGTCNCHDNINPLGNSYATIFVDNTKHINGTLEGGACNACHGYPPVSATFTGAGVQNNWSSARTENYAGGGGAHSVNAHVSKLAKHNDGFAFCVNCHSPADHLTSPEVFKPSTNIKVSVDQRYRFEAAKQFKYTSNRLDDASHVTGNCSNSSCHFGASPKWDPAH
ncbi:MAG: CxxxxCH/CxxCH domain-containing protein [Desulfuromonadaceae bacterium]|nr:CxxxxCH/CxxCH domain-containing protein [Desulfuromonadaceae bacterium]